MRSLRRTTALCVVTVVLGTGGTDPVSAQPAPVGVGGPEDPSVLSLVDDYGITIAQARAQMEAQVAAGQAEAELPAELSAVYSGRQIFHDRGGQVVVGLTDPTRSAAMREHFARFGVGRVDVRRFEATQAQLEQRVKEAQALLRAGRAAGERPNTEVSRRSVGKVAVRVARHAAGGAQARLSAAEVGIRATAAASPGIYDVVEVDTITTGSQEACDFSLDIECDPPLPGSVRITRSGSGHICSAGFNAVSRVDGKPYVLTAGHCRNYGPGTWTTQFANESAHVIGPFHNGDATVDYDAGILRVDNPTGWQFGWPLITVDPMGGEAAQENYVIDRVADPGVNDRVCATLGNTARTDCGTVIAISVPSDDTEGLFQVDNLCTNPGDSGSPYFAFHVAYGIHIAGDDEHGTTNCEWGKAEEATEAQNRMRVDILRI